MYIIALFYLYSAKLQKNCDLTKSLLEKVGILFVFFMSIMHIITDKECAKLF